MRTERLYYADGAASTCDAIVLARGERDGKPFVILDRTVFYPEGGGQPFDVGTVEDVPVVGVFEEGDAVVHVLAAPLPGGIEAVQCTIDAARRLDHAEQHTGQHLLSSVLVALFAAETVSFRMGESVSTIDVAVDSLSDTDIERAEDELDTLIREGRAVVVRQLSRAEAAKLPLRKTPPEGVEIVRVVEITGKDWSPCCGTHLQNVAALRSVRIVGRERVKGMTRVSFVAGKRAVSDARRNSSALREAALAFGCSTGEVVGKVKAGLAKVQALEGDLRRVRAACAVAEAALIVTALGDAKVATQVYTDRPFDEALECAKAIVVSGAACAVICSAQESKAACVSAPSSGCNVTALCKGVAETLGGRGGGWPTLFQASFADASSAVAFVEAARRKLQEF